MVNECYNFLISTFGHIDIKGGLYISELCAYRIEDSNFKYADAYDEIAEKYKTNRNAIERSIRYYITTIIHDSSLATVCDALDYNLNQNRTTLKVTEFVPLVKKKLVGITDCY